MPQFNFSMLAEDRPVGTTGQSSPAPAGFNFSMLEDEPVASKPDPSKMSDLERTVLGLPPKKTTLPASAVLAKNIGGAPGVALWSKLPAFLRNAADAVVAPAMRVGPAVAGGLLGGALGGPLGAAAGGAAGSGLGEMAAESLEVEAGQRQAINPLQVATQTVLGAVPVAGKAGKLLPAIASRGAQGAALGGVGSVATDLAEGQEVDLRRAATGATVGAVLGGAGGALESNIARAVPAPKPASTAAPKFNFSMLDEPVDDSGRALGGFAGPERRSAARVSTPEEDVRYARMREKLARGEQTGSAENREIGRLKSELESAREAASKERGEAPLPRTANRPSLETLESDPKNPKYAKVPFPVADEATQQRIVETADYNTPSLEKVRIGDLTATQPTVTRDVIGRKIGQTKPELTELPVGVYGRSPRNPGIPVVYRDADGTMYLGDGTHETIAKMIDGQDEIQALVYPTRASQPSLAEVPVMASAEKPPTAATTASTPKAEITAADTAPSTPRPKIGFEPPVPEQKPLSADRIAGDKKFVEHQPEPFREGISKILDENQHFEAQRRGVQPVERTNALARYVQTERMKLLPKGTALNAEELKAFADNIATVTDRIDTLSKDILAGDTLPVTRVALEKARMEQQILLANAMGARAETGRALNIHKQFAQIFESKDAQAISEASKIPGVNLEDVAKKLGTLNTDAEKLDYLRTLQKHSPLDMARSVFYANILSGVRTHIRNVFGNAMNAVRVAASHPAAVAYDAARSATTGKARTIYMGEAKPQLVGAVMGVKQGLDDALFTMQHGFTPKALGTFDVPRPELPGGAKNPFNLVGRTLEAEDQLFYGINYNRELYGRIYAKARSEGLKGDKLADRVAELKLNPPAGVREASEKAAMHAVFKEEPGKWVQGILSAKKEIPWLDFVMPFVKTPANIIRQGVEATPLAPLTKQTRDAMARGGRESAEAVGRATTGTVALAALAYWAAQGVISGTGPTDPEERSALMESGWRPNSVNIKGTWVSFDQIQPLAQPLSVIANAYDSYRADGKVDRTKVAGAVGKALLDQSFFSGVSDLNNALSDPDRYADQFVQRMVQGAVPFSGLSRNIAQAVDTTVREPKSAADTVKSVIPGLSKDVAPKLDRMGNEVERSGGSLVQLTPFNVGTPSKDPVIQELTRLKVDSLGLPPKTLAATKNTPAYELSVDERKKMGQAVRQELERLFRHPRWSDIDEDSARERIKGAAERARTRVAREIRQNRMKGLSTR